MAVGRHEVGEGVDIDATYQHISEAPAYQDPDGETVGVVDDTETGESTAENVPVPDGGNPDVPDVEGQSTLADWTGGESA